MIHRDPFDRILVALAKYGDILLLTGDDTVARYLGAVEISSGVTTSRA